MDPMPALAVEHQAGTSYSSVNISHPLEDTSYLLSAVETITASVQDRSSTSVHDLLDAYSSFSNRIRSQSKVLQNCDKPLPAFDCLIHHKAAFIEALRRDIGLAHIDPLFISSRTRSSESEPGDVPIPNVLGDTRQYARNTSLLCNHALCSLGVIIKFPVLDSLFTATELTELLGDVLSITLAQNLPILNGSKTFSLSLLILGSHRLPLESVVPLNSKLYSALRRTLESPNLNASSALDGLKAISHTLEQYASSIFSSVSHMVPLILPFLLGKSSDIRLHTSLLVGRVAAILLRPDTLPQDKKLISKHVLSFLDFHCSEAPASRNNEDFLQVVRTACSAESQARPGEGPTWMLALLASLIILSGPSLFDNSRALKFVLQCLGSVLTHQRSVVRALHPHVWKCLAWIFCEMISNTETASSAEICTALFVIKQEVGGGVGVALGAVLLHFAERLHHRSKEFVTHAFSVLQAMVYSDDKHTFQDGVLLLHAMTTGTGGVESDQHSRAFDDVLSPALFDGSIVCADWDCLPSVVRSIPRFSVLSVRPLGPAEIVAHYEPVLDIWKHCVRKQAKEKLDADLLDVWQSIVTVQSQSTADDHCAVNSHLERLAMVIIEFLPSFQRSDTEPQWGSWDVRDQQCRLAAMSQLWSAMQNVLVSSLLSGPAETILVSILKFAFHILDADVKALWSHLCASLMIAVSPSFLSGMRNLSESQMAVRTQRGLWGVVVKSLTSSNVDLHWEDVVRFLAIPVCNWPLSESELEAWEFLLQNASSSGVSFTPFTPVVEVFMRCIEGRGASDWLSMPALLGVIIACFQAEGVSPPDVVLRSIDDALISSYGRALGSAESISLSLQLLTVLRDYIRGLSPAQVLHLLVTLRHCLQIWIEDKSEVVSVGDFNAMVISLYRDSLDIVARCPLSIETLQELETFLASGFSRIPPPAIAPFAFEKFWRATYHGQTQFYDVMPARIKSCLVCFVAAYGGDLAAGFSSPMDSQSQSAGDVHESQLPPTYPSLSDIRWSFFKREQLDEVLEDQTSGTPGRPSLAPEDTAFLVASSDDEELYQPRFWVPSRDVHTPSSNALGQSPPIPGPSRGLPPLHVQEQNRKRKQPARDTPKKRLRTSCHARRKARSEPVRRETVTLKAPRINSVPVTSRRMIFDGVELPTLRDILRLEQGLSPSTRTSNDEPIRSLEYYDAPMPKVLHDEDDFDDQEGSNHVDGTSSETEIEKSLAAVYPSSPRQQNPLTDESPGETCRKSESVQGSPSVPRRAPLRGSKTTTTRLDTLRDVYASVANGASQIPASELLQATRLVHQIGVVLTEQMGKKFGASG